MKKPTLQFLGTGSAFATDNFQSNAVVTTEGGRLLIDAGGDLRHSAKKAGLGPMDFDAVYISHAHGDHCHGLEWLGIISHFAGKKIKLFARPEVISAVNEVVGPAFRSVGKSRVKATLNDTFDVQVVDREFSFGGVNYFVFKTKHCQDGPGKDMPVYGLVLSDGSENVLYSADATMELFDRRPELYQASDLIFQDCEISEKPTGVHAHFKELAKTLESRIKARTWLYHYGDGMLPDAKGEGFAGFVAQGQEFDLFRGGKEN